LDETGVLVEIYWLRNTLHPNQIILAWGVFNNLSLLIPALSMQRTQL